jgi:hypothetical protein
MEQHALRRLLVVVAIAGAAFAGWAAPAAAHHGLEEDQTIAETGVLLAADFPAGWKEDVGQNHIDAFLAAAKKVKTCKAYLAAQRLVKAAPTAPSSDYTSGTAIASNTSSVLPSLSDADQVYTAYKNVATAKCLRQVLPTTAKSDLAQDGNVSSITTTRIQPVTPIITGAEQAAGYHLRLNAKIGGKTKTVYVDSWLAQNGRAIETLDFESIGESFDSTIASNAANAATARLAEAMAGAPEVGESASLAKFLPTIHGYTYVQPLAAVSSELAGLVTNSEGDLTGASTHGVASPTGEQFAVLQLLEFAPEVASLPGFRAGQLEYDANGLAEDSEAGVATQLQIAGQPAWLVTSAEGNVRLFWCGNVEAGLFSDESSDAQAEVFATEFVKACT